MNRGPQRSLVAWGFAGIPILATFIQTTLALLETTLGSAGLESLQSGIRSIAVFDTAAILMWKSPTVLIILFVLITAAWVTQGVMQFLRGNRDLTFAAAGLVSVLFFALFFGVYSPMFGMDVPTTQVAAFFAVPVLASVAAIWSAFEYDWDREVIEEKSAELATVETELGRKREAFEDSFRQRIGEFDALADIAPTGVERTRKSRQEFRERCDELEADAEAVRGQPAEKLRAETASLESRVAEIDPEAEVERVDEDLRDHLTSGIRTTYGTIQCWSRYDQSYELVNLPSRFREVEIPAFDVTVNIDRIDDAFLDRIEQGVALQTIAEGVAQVDAHIERVEEHVAEREVAFAGVAETAESDVETVVEKVEQFDGRVRERLLELAVEGRHDDLPSVRTVEDRLDEGKDALHDCWFDDAERAAEDAAEDAGELVTLVEFLWSVVGTIEHGGEQVSLPKDLDSTAVMELRPAFESEYDIEFEVTDGTVGVVSSGKTTVDDGDTFEPDAETTASVAQNVPENMAGQGSTTGRDGTTNRGDEQDGSGVDRGNRQTDRTEQPRPEEIIDKVLYVFRELKVAGDSTDDERAELQTDTLPDDIATPAVLTQIERFGQRQNDVLQQIHVQENAPPGFVELVPKDGMTVSRAVDTLHERYREQYE